MFLKNQKKNNHFYLSYGKFRVVRSEGKTKIEKYYYKFMIINFIYCESLLRHFLMGSTLQIWLKKNMDNAFIFGTGLKKKCSKKWI